MVIVFVIFRFTNMSFGIKCYELLMFNDFLAITTRNGRTDMKQMKLFFMSIRNTTSLFNFFVNSLKLILWQIADNFTITSL